MLWFIITICAIFVYYDATKNKIGKIADEKRFTNMSAGMWSVGVLLLWIIIFPLYLIKRSSLIEKAKENPQDVSLRGGKLAFLSVVSLASILIPIYTGYVQAMNDSSVHASSASSSSNQSSHYSRDDFRSLVANKTEQEVLKILGRPSQTQDVGSTKAWTYTGVTYDPVTQNADAMAMISFQNGRVDNVSFI